MYINKISVLVIATIMMNSCSIKNAKNKQLTIVTTTGIIGDCVSQIVGEQAKVISIMGAGVDPHLYKASQGDIAKLSQADIIVYNGLHLEGKMAQMLENFSKTKPVFSIGDYIEKTDLKEVDKTSDLVDPHVWFSPNLWIDGLGGVALELDKLEGLDSIIERYKSYALEIKSTQTMLQKLLDKNLDSNERILITSHDAFEYFGDAFKFKVRGLQGISTTAEYGTKDIKDLTDFIINNNIKSVFVETSVPNKNLEAVVASAQARDYSIRIGGTLYSDALGEKNTPAGTYKGMLISNVQTIIKGLK
ncbi:MAG: zinc ABC transporter substrate-binding protein [Bacteroidia bacterium]|nr:zinc ABC transporter substrate-binding protein [Bacteroidia bacterium]